MMTDSHAHLHAVEFDADRAQVLTRARNAGVNVIITVGTDVETSRKNLEIASQTEGIFVAVGVHPNDLGGVESSWPETIQELASHPKVKAIGETGLDLYRHRVDPAVQKEALIKHLEIASSRGLPVILHSRAAGHDVLNVLEEFSKGRPIRGVMHCFTEHEDVMRRAVAMGLYISFAGPLTYPISRKAREVMKAVPDSRILVETDSPFLGAEPVKHRRNEPAYLRYVLTKVAETRRISPRDAARITSLNADTLFGLNLVDRSPKIAYGIRSNLYLNITNRCSSCCTFCPRARAETGELPKEEAYYVKGHNLRLEREPSAQEVIAAMGEISPYKEIVFCGLGEPTLRLDVLLEVARWARSQGARVRLDTNGHGNIIHGRSIVGELAEVLDAVWVSLNAATAEEYDRLCRPERPGETFNSILNFIREARERIPEVVVTAVEVRGIDVAALRALARELGVKYHGRKPDEVG